MTLSQTSRMLLPQWSDPSDAPTRAQFNDAFAKIESKSIIGTAGVVAALPAAGTPSRVYYATDTRELFWDTGSSWQQIGSHIYGALTVAQGNSPSNFLTLNDAGGSSIGHIDSVGNVFVPAIRRPSGSDTPTALTLINGFTNVNSAGGFYPIASYYYTIDGWVHVCGKIRTHGNQDTFINVGSHMPPPADNYVHEFLCSFGDDATSRQSAITVLAYPISGQLWMAQRDVNGLDASTTTNGFLSLDGISYYAG